MNRKNFHQTETVTTWQSLTNCYYNYFRSKMMTMPTKLSTMPRKWKWHYYSGLMILNGCCCCCCCLSPLLQDPCLKRHGQCLKDPDNWKRNRNSSRIYCVIELNLITDYSLYSKLWLILNRCCWRRSKRMNVAASSYD